MDWEISDPLFSNEKAATVGTAAAFSFEMTVLLGTNPKSKMLFLLFQTAKRSFSLLFQRFMIIERFVVGEDSFDYHEVETRRQCRTLLTSNQKPPAL